MKPTLIYSNFAEERKQKIESLCSSLNIATRNVEANEHNKTIEKILQENIEQNTNAKKYFDDEIIVFFAFDNNLLELFLQQMRQTIGIVPLKAVVTTTNTKWSLVQLHSELVKEHRYFKK